MSIADQIQSPADAFMDWLKGTARNGKVARSTAAAWMTLLIGVPVAVAFLTVWGGLAKTTRPDELSVAALKLFAVWCLSFLPGWLYVRFLGQRAGALWDGYVLYLHRLGWDRPAHLPSPPKLGLLPGMAPRQGQPAAQGAQHLPAEVHRLLRSLHRRRRPQRGRGMSGARSARS